MDKLEQIAGLSGQLTLGGKAYVVLPPTTGDVLREALQMKQFARAAGRADPLRYVAERASLLAPAALAAAAAEAVRVASAAAPEPERVVVEEQYGLPDGVRWRVWYHVNRSGQKLTEDEARALVTDFNCGCVCVALDDALRLPEVDEGKKAPPPTGTGG